MSLENGDIPSNDIVPAKEETTDEKHRRRHGSREDRHKDRRDKREKRKLEKARRSKRDSSLGAESSEKRKRRAEKAKRPPKPKQQENGDDPTSETSSLEQISLLLKRLHDPTVVKRVEAANAKKNLAHVDLTCIPWCIRITSKDDTSTHPSWSYLDLRRKQNEHWATRRLHDGVKLAKESKWRQAEACYKEGLDLVPDHAELRVAYGALCANTGRKREAIDRLERVVRDFPGVANAQQYLDAIRSSHKGNIPIRATAAETAMRDVLAERAFLADTTKNNAQPTRKSDTDKKGEKYPILPHREADGDASSEDSSSAYRKKRKRLHHERRQRRDRRESRTKRRKKRKRQRSLSFSSDYSSDRRSRHKRRRQRHRSPSLSSSESSRCSRHGRRPSFSPFHKDYRNSGEPDPVNAKGPDEEQDGSRSQSPSHRGRRGHGHEASRLPDESDISSRKHEQSSSRRHKRHRRSKHSRKHKKRRNKERRHRSPSMFDSEILNSRKETKGKNDAST